MEKEKIRAKEKLIRKRMNFRFYFVVVLLIFGVIADFVDGLEQVGFAARYIGVLALAVYSLFFVTSVPEEKENLQALVKSFYIGLFAFAFTGFVIMAVGQEKILQVKISTIVAFFSLVFVLMSLLAFKHLGRKKGTSKS